VFVGLCVKQHLWSLFVPFSPQPVYVLIVFIVLTHCCFSVKKKEKRKWANVVGKFWQQLQKNSSRLIVFPALQG
jgi:hypothetical protein